MVGCNYRLVFVDGVFSASESVTTGLDGGLVVTNQLAASQHYPDLVDSTCEGAFIYLPDKCCLESPVEIVMKSTGQQPNHNSTFENRVVVGVSSKLSFFESYETLSDEPYSNHVKTSLIAKQGSSIRHYKLQTESGKGSHKASIQINQQRDSEVHSHNFSIGGAVSQDDITVDLDESGASCVIDGLYVLDGEQRGSHKIQVNHLVPHCSSSETYKGILNDRAVGSFQGLVKVNKAAQKTVAHQLNKNILLSDLARVRAKPELEIYADDVTCSHGATVGQLDQRALFYLRSRGISERVARQLLTFAFAKELLARVVDMGLRERLEAVIMQKLER